MINLLHVRGALQMRIQIVHSNELAVARIALICAACSMYCQWTKSPHATLGGCL